MSAEVVEAVGEKIIRAAATRLVARRRLACRRADRRAGCAGMSTPIERLGISRRPSARSFAMQSNGVAIDRALDRFLPAQQHQCQPQYRRACSGFTTLAGVHATASRPGISRCAACKPAAGRRLRPARDHRAAPGRTRSRGRLFRRSIATHGISEVSFSIDECEGANRASSFGARDYKAALTAFILAQSCGAPIGRAMRSTSARLSESRKSWSASKCAGNEQVEPWAAAGGRRRRQRHRPSRPNSWRRSCAGLRRFRIRQYPHRRSRRFLAGAQTSGKSTAKSPPASPPAKRTVPLFCGLRRRFAGQQILRAWRPGRDRDPILPPHDPSGGRCPFGLSRPYARIYGGESQRRPHDRE